MTGAALSVNEQVLAQRSAARTVEQDEKILHELHKLTNQVEGIVVRNYFNYSNLIFANTRPKRVVGGLAFQDSFFTKQIDSVRIIVDERNRA
jgi:hypothetical protein